MMFYSIGKGDMNVYICMCVCVCVCIVEGGEKIAPVDIEGYSTLLPQEVLIHLEGFARGAERGWMKGRVVGIEHTGGHLE